VADDSVCGSVHGYVSVSSCSLAVSSKSEVLVVVGAVTVDIIVVVNDRGVLLKSMEQAHYWFSLYTTHQ